MSLIRSRHRGNRRANVRAAALAVASTLIGSSAARAVDTSPPVILQWFESSWKTMEKRIPDHFMAGYGAIWTPPPGRALYDDQGGGIGYNLYDRFDLGKAKDPTLYGTETGYRALINQVHQANGDVYVDYVHHHVGSWDVPGYNGWGGFTPTKFIQDRSDYPGFELSDPYVGANSFDPNYRNLPGQRDSYPDAPPVNDGNTPQYQYQYRLAHLITIDLTSTRSFVRNPVPGNANDIRQAPNGWAIGTSAIQANGKPGASTILRQANTPDANNTRFYPDQNLPGITVTDPANGGGTYTIYPFNKANPSAGDPTSETNAGYMMRYAQWLTNDIGVDGLRIDAARHVPYGVSGDPYNPTNLNMPALVDRATFRQSQRFNLDGTQRQVFNFQEVFTGDQNLLQNFIRKDINPATPNVVGGNRDVLDFPMWFAMRSNLTSNGLQNNWYNIRNASIDGHDDGLANNGSQGIGFVINHDDGKGPGGNDYIALDNVAHAWILTRPGNAYVYFNAHEFDRSGNNEFFLKDGRGDALGGQYGNIITRLVDIRNSYGRGNFQERWIDGGGGGGGFSNVYAYERQGSMIVGLNSALGTTTNYDQRTMNTSFPAGTHLEELTGNADDAQVDPLNQINNTLVVDGSGQVTMRIPRNQNTNGVTHGRGYVMYGLPRPRGAVSLTNVSQALAAESTGNNATDRLTAINVITGNSFNINLNTTAVTLSDSFRDFNADGDRAYVRIDGGLDLNNSGSVDFRTSGDTRYGFENFTTANDGFHQISGNGTYSIGVNAANLSEGYHYVTARAFRHTSFAGEQDVFTDFKKVVYVDRLKPVSALDNAAVLGGNDREVRSRSTDGTADSVATFMNLPANMTDAQIIALATGTNSATQIDRDVFAKSFTNVVNGNNAVTIVTREITGNTNVQRFVGVNLLTTNGAGLGDLNQNGTYETGDVTGTAYGMEAIVYPNGSGTTNFAFNAAADINADGLIDSRDLYGLEARYAAVNPPQNVKVAAREAVLRRGNLNGDGVTDDKDIDHLYANFGNTAWKYDLDVDGWPTPSGADQQDMDILVKTIFKTRYGDANLDGRITFDDYVKIDLGFNSHSTGWLNGDFNGSGVVNFDDYVIIDINFNEQGAGAAAVLARAQAWLSGDDRSMAGMDTPGMQLVIDHFGELGVPYASAFIAAVPEPSSAMIVLAAPVLAGVFRRRRYRNK